MFDLKQNPHRIALPLLFAIFVTTAANAQFDTVIFVKKAPYWNEAVIYMGDQNDDGYDDFILCVQDANVGPNGYANFYYGGNPVSSTPALKFPYYAPTTTTACDVNRDGYRDLVVQRRGNVKPQIIDIYYGGPEIDTISDFSFSWIDNISDLVEMMGHNWPIDFDGDGFEDFVCISGYNVTSGFLNDRIYFFRTDSLMTTQAYHKIELFPDQSYQIKRSYTSFADIDGDRKTDISIVLGKYSAPTAAPERKVRFYYGNTDFDFNDFYEITDTMAYVDHTYLIQDLNNDGKGEIIFNNPGTHPDWYSDVFSFGTRPPNFTVEQGINTQDYPWAAAFSPGDINADGCNDMFRHLPYYIMNLYLGGYPMQEERTKVYSSSSSGIYRINFGGRIGDVDGDGVDDICIGENGGTDHTGTNQPGNIYIIKGTRSPVSVKDEAAPETTESPLTLNISPNPTSSSLNIAYTLPFEGEVKISIHDITGKKVYSTTQIENSGEHASFVDISKIVKSSGVYILTIELHQGDKSVSKSLKLQFLK